MKVLICSLLRVPDGDAGSIRQHKLSVMCQNLGHEVLLVGLGKSNGMQPQEYKGVRFVSLREGGESFKDKAASRIRYWRRFKKVLNTFKPDVIIMDSLGVYRTIRLKQYCEKNRVILIHDSVEWYSPEQFNHGKLSLRYLKKDFQNRVLINKRFRVIAISRYLQRHFESKGCQCVRIPIVITEDDICLDKQLPENKVVFTYAGQPGKKDYLQVMLDAFALLPADMLSKVVFNVVGCTKEQMIASGISRDLLEKLKTQLVIHGRVSHEEVLRILKETHFTLLMRSPVQRYAKAGFPTKVVESLSRSTPVICNLTSDLAMYLQDGENSLIVDGCDAISLMNVLIEALNMTEDDRNTMCQKAVLAASEHFNLVKYLEQLAMLMV